MFDDRNNMHASANINVLNCVAVDLDSNSAVTQNGGQVKVDSVVAPIEKSQTRQPSVLPNSQNSGAPSVSKVKINLSRYLDHVSMTYPD